MLEKALAVENGNPAHDKRECSDANSSDRSAYTCFPFDSLLLFLKDTECSSSMNIINQKFKNKHVGPCNGEILRTSP